MIYNCLNVVNHRKLFSHQILVFELFQLCGIHKTIDLKRKAIFINGIREITLIDFFSPETSTKCFLIAQLS